MTSEDIKKIGSQELKTFAEAAEQSPRRRKQRNLHKVEDPIQRIIRVMQPQTYMQPHRHLGEAPFRLFSLLEGRVGVIFFNENGETTDATLLSPNEGCRAVEIPGEQFFTLICLERGSALLEVREGPIQKDTREMLAGFPDEMEFLQSGGAGPIGERVQTLLQKWTDDLVKHQHVTTN